MRLKEIKDTADVLELDYECYGSTTWKRELKKAGIESDNCFYYELPQAGFA
ncbi:hypothetical protein [Nostoc sp. ATCC 53789]|uniref:hypothetical protein n=1 Tax=Nostoc sp. ATCC 53789 TaxID=76335 RepID=UPI00215D7D1A|nr:hypothetical protein [Nostoc sp. ATCC 53789]